MSRPADGIPQNTEVNVTDTRTAPAVDRSPPSLLPLPLKMRPVRRIEKRERTGKRGTTGELSATTVTTAVVTEAGEFGKHINNDTPYFAETSSSARHLSQGQQGWQ